MREKVSNSKKNNEGSALITVIVFVAFITILATILLYITGVNFQIKQNDYRNKKSFYAGETALEEIKAHLTEDISNASLVAYDRSMKEYVGKSPNTRKADFTMYFMTELQRIWTDKVAACGSWESLLTSYRTSGNVKVTGSVVDYNSAVDESHIYLRGIQLEYCTTDGYMTMISTDIVIMPPALEWGVSESASTLDSVMNNPTGRAFEQNAPNVVDIARCVDYYNWEKK